MCRNFPLRRPDGLADHDQHADKRKHDNRVHRGEGCGGLGQNGAGGIRWLLHGLWIAKAPVGVKRFVRLAVELPEQAGQVGLVEPVEAERAGTGQGLAVFRTAHPAAEFRIPLGLAAGVVLGHEVHIGAGRDLFGQEAEDGRGLGAQAGHEQVADEQAAPGQAVRADLQAAHLTVNDWMARRAQSG